MNTTGKKTEIQESGSKIRTWRVTDFIARTAGLLIGYRRPFHFDGDFYMPNNSCKFVPKASPYKWYDYNF